MPMTAGLTNAIKQIAAEAMAPVASTVKIVLLKVGYTGTYDATLTTYTAGLGGDEHAASGGYTQGGLTLGTRTAGVSAGVGYVDYADAVWSAATISSPGALIVDTTNNRVIGVIDFGGTISSTNGDFTVTIPASGTGFIRAA